MNIHLMVKEVTKISVHVEKQNCEVEFNNGDYHYIGDIYLNNIETDCTSVMVSYYFENEETQINKKSFSLYSSYKKYFECNKSKFNNKTGKLVLWINDSYNKIVSPKITIVLE